MKTLTKEQFEKQFGKEAYNGFGQVAPEQPGFLSEVKSRISGVGQDVREQYLGEGQYAGQSTPRRATGVVASAFSTPLGLAKDALPEFAEKGLEKTGEGIGKGLQWVAEKTTPQFLVDFVSKHPKAAKALEEAAGTLANTGAIAGDILTIGAGAKVAQKGADLSVKAGQKVGQGIDKLVSKAPDALEQGKKLLQPPPPKPTDAVGQVLQGGTKDIKTGVRAFKELDTTGVKTYDDLLTKTTETIKSLSKQVDDTLDNTKPVTLGKLKLIGKTTAGKKVSVDYVSRSLENLKELYVSTGDDVGAKNIGELINKAKTLGLTRQEVNNISRTYGQEFGQKAFSKMGDPLTSVNAQRFENTRKALKKVARQGISGEKAKALDESIGDIYRVQDLVRKNVEAVQKLEQKIQQRGLLEKIGYGVAKGADIVTGGGIRGIMGGLLPRGVGYKVMNALDLQTSLQRNLDIIQKAIKASDPEVIKLLRKVTEKGLIQK